MITLISTQGLHNENYHDKSRTPCIEFSESMIERWLIDLIPLAHDMEMTKREPIKKKINYMPIQYMSIIYLLRNYQNGGGLGDRGVTDL